MKKFYVGQRIRRKEGNTPRLLGVDPSNVVVPVGALGYIRPDSWNRPDGWYITEWDGVRSEHESGCFSTHESIIEPVYDADDFSRFIERTLKPIPEVTPDFVGYVERFPA